MGEVAGRKVIEIGAVELTVKELSVSEIRAMLVSAETDDEIDPVGDFLFQDIRLRDLMEFTTLTKDQLDRMLPSQIEEAIQECKAMNRHFFDLGERLVRSQAKL